MPAQSRISRAARLALLALAGIAALSCKARHDDAGLKEFEPPPDLPPEALASGLLGEERPHKVMSNLLCISRAFRTDTNVVVDAAKADPDKKMIFSEFDPIDVAGHPANEYWMAVAAAMAYDHDFKSVEAELRTQFGATEVIQLERRFGGAATAFLPKWYQVDSQAFIANIGHDTRYDVTGREVDLGFTKEKTKDLISVKDFALVAFRGTELPDATWRDVFTDAVNMAPCAYPMVDLKVCNPKPGPLGLVHGGFARASRFLYGRIKAELKRINKPIVLTGHSLGGAMATLVAASLMAEHDPQLRVAALYTYGSPIVGTQSFVSAFDALAKEAGLKMRRVVNRNDVVTRIPEPITSALMFPINAAGEIISGFQSNSAALINIPDGGWRHVGFQVGTGGALVPTRSFDGDLLWFNDKERPFANAVALERMTDTRWIRLLQPLSWVGDHDIGKYAQKLEKNAFLSVSNCDGGKPGDAPE